MFRKMRYAFEDAIDWVRDLDPILKWIIGVIFFVVVSIFLLLALGATNSGNNPESTTETVSETVVESNENTASDESNDSSESTTSKEPETSSETTNEEQVISTVNVFFNGTMVKTYSKEDAMASAGVNLSDFSDSRQIEVQAVIGYGQEVSRIRVWTENESGGNNGDEYFLYSDTDWTTTLNLEDYSGTILIAIAISDNSVPPHIDYAYFKVILD